VKNIIRCSFVWLDLSNVLWGCPRFEKKSLWPYGPFGRVSTFRNAGGVGEPREVAPASSPRGINPIWPSKERGTSLAKNEPSTRVKHVHVNKFLKYLKKYRFGACTRATSRDTLLDINFGRPVGTV
jgi:hypothetical protein